MRSTLVTLLLAGKALADYTVTQTNYITPDCFSYKIQSILHPNANKREFTSASPTGIPVVFVYDDGSSPNDPSTFVTTSDIIYTVNTVTPTTQAFTTCSSGGCDTTTTSTNVPVQYTRSTQITYTTSSIPITSLATSSSVSSSFVSHSSVPSPSSSISSSSSVSSSKVRSTRFETETITQNSQLSLTITKSASTKTTTIFSATTTPVTKFNTTTSYQSITETQQNPVTSASVVSQSKNTTITTSHLTTGITFTESTSVPVNATVNPTKQSNWTIPVTTSQASYYSSFRINGTTVLAASSSVGYHNSSILPATNRTYLVTFNGSSVSSLLVPSTTLTSLQGTSISTTTEESLASRGSSSVASSSSSTSISKTSTSTASSGYSGSLFDVIDTSVPPSVFPREDLPLAIPSGVDNNNVPISTNKFYANLFLGTQQSMVYAFPYGLYWDNNNYYGFGVQHTNVSNRVSGTSSTNNPNFWSYYFNPILNAELIFSATQLSSGNNFMFVTEGKDMSVNVKLSPTNSLGSNYLEIPIVQGMGFTTTIYHGSLTPVLNSLEGVQTVTQESSTALPSNVLKFRVTLFNGIEWLVYVSSSSSSAIQSFTFDVTSPYELTGSASIDGLVVQVAIAPDSSKDGFYDEAAGLYVTGASVQGQVSGGTQASYLFNYETSGKSSSGKTIVFALPHHVQSLSSDSSNANTGITLSSTTKGEMQGFLTNQLTLVETLQTDIEYLPWTRLDDTLSYSADQLQLLAQVANEELAVDIPLTVANMDSNYFSGKVIDKYAYILLVVNDIIQDETIAKSTLADLKSAFQTFIDNEQYYPLMYDTRWGGVTSTASQNGDTGADFGSAYYNDHHFHYGYFVHAAAVVGYVDKQYGGTWAEDNKDWVNALIRDVANPSEEDTYFPVSRMFDWFNGHSWAAGLYESGDGKNQESSSEDYNFSYGMKLWGSVIGDQSMESRGSLMLAVQARSMNDYFLYSDDNTIEPPQYIGNKVSGILFENKIAYTTYFGSPDVHPEYVHGIHMLPVTPVSSLIRGPTFVQQEWEQQISTFVANSDESWLGILYLNQALYDPKSSYDFFSSSSFNNNYLDNGQSRTWCLAYSGGFAN